MRTTHSPAPSVSRTPRFPLRTIVLGCAACALTLAVVSGAVPHGPSGGPAQLPVADAGLASALPGGSVASEARVYGPFMIGPAGPVMAATPVGVAAPLVSTTAQPGSAAAAAISFALAQRGLPYVWGGNGPQQGHAGFDCSGLTTAAYAFAGVSLPRTAHTQFYAGPHVPSASPLLPGDLVFYGTPQRVHHVGLYLGDGRMINAPRFGQPVQIASVRYAGDRYLGATRPAAGRDAPGLIATADLPVVVPPLPAPGAPPAPDEFPAPPAPDQSIPVLPPGPVPPGPIPPPTTTPVVPPGTSTPIVPPGSTITPPVVPTTPPTTAPTTPPTTPPPNDEGGEDTGTPTTPPSSTRPTTPPSTPPATSPSTPPATRPTTSRPPTGTIPAPTTPDDSTPDTTTPTSTVPRSTAPQSTAPTSTTPGTASTGTEPTPT